MTQADLKRALFTEYGGFADKRYKDLTRNLPFIVDDRTDGDKDARGQLFHWFCLIFVEVEGEEAIKVTLRGEIPENRTVQAWFTRHAERNHSECVFQVTAEKSYLLNELADLIEDVVAPGRHYSVPAYKYTCPRTSSSLRRLKRVLDSVWD